MATSTMPSPMEQEPKQHLNNVWEKVSVHKSYNNNEELHNVSSFQETRVKSN